MSRSESPPAVSVLMAVYNGEKYLAETLDTLLAQTLRGFELVVVDDGSSDRTAEILSAYAERDARIRPVHNERNLKLPGSLNRGLELCRAPLVARADADDLYVPEYLETQVRFLRDNPQIGVVSSAFHVADLDGRVLYTRCPPTDDRQIRFQLLFMSCLLHPTTVFRAHVVRDVGGYRDEYHMAEDYELWSRLRDRTRFANQAVPLVRYRRHPQAIMRNRGAVGEELSHSVSQRLLTEYLRVPVTLSDATVLRLLYRGIGALPLGSVPGGLTLLNRILGQARRVEDPRTVREFRERISQNLIERSVELADADRGVSRALFWSALRWNPTDRVRRINTIKLGGRLYVPERAVQYARDVLHGVKQ
jgi:glycosyltransferase involved in cell wall biosynthesis